MPKTPALNAGFFLLCLGAALPAAAAAAEDVTAFALDNGLDVVVIEDHRAPVVTQMVWYRIGAADEAPGHSGIAHFFELQVSEGFELSNDSWTQDEHRDIIEYRWWNVRELLESDERLGPPGLETLLRNHFLK